MTRRTAIAAAAVLALSAPFSSAGVFAQSPFGPAPTEALDELSGGSANPFGPGAGGGGGNPFGAAAATGGGDGGGGNPFGAPAAGGDGGGGGNPFGAAAATGGGGDGGGNPFGAPAAGGGGGAPAGGGGNPFGGGAGGPFGAPGGGAPAGGGVGAAFGGPPPGAGGFGGTAGGPAAQQLPPLPQTTRVLVGERIYCPVTGRLIEDARWQQVWTYEAQRNFYDDGTHGDAVANDTFYTNIRDREDEVSSVAWRMLHQNRQMIDLAAEMEPHVFFKLTATSTAQGSILPNTVDKEREQDARVEEWSGKFLRDYRKDPNDDLSDFYSPYIPQPPQAPDVPPPANFAAPDPSAAGDTRDSFDRFLDTGGGLLPDPQNPQTGIPSNPAASSSYFATN